MFAIALMSFVYAKTVYLVSHFSELLFLPPDEI